MRLKIVLPLVAVGLAAPLALGAALALRDGSAPPASAPAAVSTPAPSPKSDESVKSRQFTPDAAAVLATELTSGDPAEVNGALAVPTGWTAPATFIASFRGAELAVDPTAMTDDGHGYGTVTFQEKGKRWTITVVYAGGRWKLVADTEGVR
jgi:hypothetical protein